MESEIKILMVDFNGTTPAYTRYLSSMLNNTGVKVNNLGYNNRDDSEIKKVLNYVGINTKIKPLNYFLNWIYLIINANSYHVIHIQWLPFLKYSSLDLHFLFLLKLRNKNIFYTAHNLFPHDNKREKVKKRFLKLYHSLNNIVVHTNKTTKGLRDLGYKKNIIKINHGLFYNGFNNEAIKFSNRIVMLGTISRYKGHKDAIKSIKILNERGNDLLLHIEGLGSSDYVLELENMVEQLNLKKNVFIDNNYMSSEKLISLYKEAFVALLPYKKIEQSGVVFTAFGLKTPVVAYNVGGLSEVIIDKKNGRLAEKNNFKEFLECVDWVYKNQIFLKENLQEAKYEDLWLASAKILRQKYTEISK